MTVPLILEEISLLPNDQGVKALLPLQFVACGGGPLKLSVGEKLATAGVNVLSHFGATEVGPMAPIFAPTPDYDWHYFRLRQDMDFDLEPVDSDGERNVRYFMLTAHPFGWEKSFELQDRLVNSLKHPSTDFKAVGRNDDLIVLATGEKVLPRILESLLSESPLVKAAVVFGDGQFELGVIVEPASPTEDHGQFKSSIWPIVVDACNQMDDHARVSSTTSIIVAPQGRCVPRSDKGSVLRKEAFRLFEAEIRKVYQDLDNPTIETSASLLDARNLEVSLKKMIQFNLNWTVPIQDWTFEDDLFELGMNSLQAVRLRRLLLSSFPHNNPTFLSAERISIDFVYKYASVAKLAQALRDDGDLNGTHNDLEHKIEDFTNLYSLKQPTSPELQHGTGSVVLLTGSTGSLGTHLLAQLASLPNVARVVCLNRLPLDARYHHQDAYERQFKTAETKGVTIPLQDRLKIEVILIDPAAPHLGLQDAEYARLRRSVTHIMHCAWPMDFKRQLSSFQNQFRFLNSLLTLVTDAHDIRPLLKPRLLFISSIAVVGEYALVHGTRIVPEVPIHDPKCTNRFGYGQAKLICERIIENAARTHQDSIEVSCVRVGQMSGSQKSGFWNANEHIPTLVQLSQKVSYLPAIDGVGIANDIETAKSLANALPQTLSWLPVDLAATSLSEILLTHHPLNLIYHLENPVRQSWHEILTTLASQLGISREFLPFDKWLDRVGAIAADTEDSGADGVDREAHELSNNNKEGPITPKDNSSFSPAPPHMLADFFRKDFLHMAGGDVIMDTAGARRISATLRDSDAVKADVVKRYVEGLRVGFWVKGLEGIVMRDLEGWEEFGS